MALSVLSLVSLAVLGWYANSLYKRRGAWPRLSSKDTVLITGGADGLGLELVKEFLVRGLKVIVVDKDEISDVSIREKVLYEQCDLAEESDVLSLVRNVEIKHGLPTILINNAGMRNTETLEEITYSTIHAIIQVNTMAPLILMKEMLSRTRRLYVVNVASVLGLASPAKLTIYSATKAALISLHDSVSHENSDLNKRFLLVAPGQLNTRMFNDIQPPKQWLAPVVDAQTLARRIVRCCEIGERGTLHGPLYTYFIPVMRMLPYGWAELSRKFSNMDTAVNKMQ